MLSVSSRTKPTVIPASTHSSRRLWFRGKAMSTDSCVERNWLDACSICLRTALSFHRSTCAGLRPNGGEGASSRVGADEAKAIGNVFDHPAEGQDLITKRIGAVKVPIRLSLSPFLGQSVDFVRCLDFGLKQTE